MKTHTIRIPKIHLSCFVRIYTRLTEAKEVHDHVWVIYVLLVEFEGLFVVHMSEHSRDMQEWISLIIRDRIQVFPALARLYMLGVLSIAS